MPYFRKKPVVVSAIQWFKDGDHPAVVSYSQSDGYQRGDYHFVVETLEGRMRVNPGDWIITGVMGEVYVCRDDIFQATYEAVDEPGVLCEASLEKGLRMIREAAEAQGIDLVLGARQKSRI